MRPVPKPEAEMARAATAEQVAAWQRVIGEQERGDETHAEFCDRRGLKLESFRAWKYRLAREEPERRGERPTAMSFVPVKIIERPVDGSSGVELALPGGRVVRLVAAQDVEIAR